MVARQFVHLTSDPDYAGRVANAKGGDVVLTVRSAAAHAVGVAFRRANEHVWLTERVAAHFLIEPVGARGEGSVPEIS